MSDDTVSEFPEETQLLDLTMRYNIAVSYLDSTKDVVTDRIAKVMNLFEGVESLNPLFIPSLEADTYPSDEIALEALSDFLGSLVDTIRDAYNKFMSRLDHLFDSFKLLIKDAKGQIKILDKELKSGKLELKEGKITLGKNQQRWMLSNGKPINPVSGMNLLLGILNPKFSDQWFRAINPIFKDWNSYEGILKLIEQATLQGIQSIGMKAVKHNSQIQVYETDPDGLPGGLLFSISLTPYKVGPKQYWHIAGGSTIWDKTPTMKTEVHEIDAFDLNTFKQILNGLENLVKEIETGVNAIQASSQKQYDAFRDHYSTELAGLDFTEADNKRIWVASLGLFTIMYWYLNDTHGFTKSYLTAMTGICKKCRA